MFRLTPSDVCRPGHDGNPDGNCIVWHGPLGSEQWSSGLASVHTTAGQNKLCWRIGSQSGTSGSFEKSLHSAKQSIVFDWSWSVLPTITAFALFHLHHCKYEINNSGHSCQYSLRKQDCQNWKRPPWWHCQQFPWKHRQLTHHIQIFSCIYRKKNAHNFIMWSRRKTTSLMWLYIKPTTLIESN